MRIGLLTTSFPRTASDVPGQFVLGFARSLAARGHTLEVLAPEPHEDRYREPPRFDGIDVRWVRYGPRAIERTFYGAGVVDNLRRDPRAWLGVLPFVTALTREAQTRVQGWDAIVSHWALPCALVAGLVRGTRPHLAVLHSADVFVLEHLPLRSRVAARIAAGADALVCSSRNLRERLLASLEPVSRIEASARTHVCAMGIDPSPLMVNTSPSDRLRIVSLGRLVKIKGLEHASHATAQLADAELVIAGDGPERRNLEALAARLRAPVRFTGELRGPAKFALFGSAHAFVLPSIPLASGRTEGMPTTLLEAMDAGLPVVASDTGGVSDVVHHGENGFVVAPGDAAALGRALARLRDPALRTRLSADARETARDYHWERLAPHFESFLISRT